ncbi:unnamed protein product [Lactuca virosa]|uniref:Reverse transcriptase Ty1/copia-type domain-containing protein n=1 Tax=Lactuca virosa TaxID=75947 RepID=A0AAU9MWA0_9ASTR|nr:unnamed protein product [Lactuca virosa]
MQNYDLSFLLSNKSDATAANSSPALSLSVHIHCSPQSTSTTVQTKQTSTIIDPDVSTPNTPSTPMTPSSPIVGTPTYAYSSPTPPPVDAPSTNLIDQGTTVVSTPGVTTKIRVVQVFPCKFTDDTVWYDPTKRSFTAATIQSYRLALSDPAWRIAMESEFVALQQNNTWVLVPRPAGIEVLHNSGGITLMQHKYATDLLQRANMQNCKSISTPMSVTYKLALNLGTSLNDEYTFKYRSVFGGLQYLALTRPDIAFPVNKVCQYLSKPTNVHWEAVKRIVRFVKGTITTRLRIRKSPPTSLSVFTNVDWAWYLDYRRSTGGFVVFLGPNLVSWSSRKQPIVSRSSTESEYKVLANGIAEATWI